MIKRTFFTCIIICLLLILLFPFRTKASSEKTYDVQFPAIMIAETVQSVTILSPDTADHQDTITVFATLNGEKISLLFIDGSATYNFQSEKGVTPELVIENSTFTATGRPIPLWLSIIPPLLAIVFALFFREVYTALLVGLLSGTSIIAFFGGNGAIASVFIGLLRIIDTYVVETLSNTGHASIIVFSLLIGGMVNIITRNAGMKGVVKRLSRYAANKRSGLLVTWVLGIAVFFDDYANTLVVGNTMRPVTDKLKVSREKLSYVVDSTAAPISAIAFITTWIGAELSYIQNGVQTINATYSGAITQSAYTIFMNSLAYSFYPILTLGFVLFIIISQRDYGPMLKAERLSWQDNTTPGEPKITESVGLEELHVSEEIPARGRNAVIPVLTVIFGAIAGLIYTGLQEQEWVSAAGFATNLSKVIGAANTFQALLWASFGGVFVAVILSLSQRLLSLKESMDAMVNGFKTMLSAIIILVLAWSLAKLTENMQTATFLSNLMLDMKLSPYLIPAITFILASLVAFSTGSSWGTMAILYPLLLPTTWSVCVEFSLDHNHSLIIFYNVVASILAGSVFGDHCSPISDTTILSSLATSCNHIEHVRTQLPYALTVGFSSLLLGTIPTAYGVPVWLSFCISLIVLWLIIRFIGKKNNVIRQ